MLTFHEFILTFNEFLLTFHEFIPTFNEFIPTFNEFILTFNEFILTQLMTPLLASILRSLVCLCIALKPVGLRKAQELCKSRYDFASRRKKLR